MDQGWGLVNAAAAVEAPSGDGTPVAFAGADQSVRPGSTVQLDGSGSIDPDGDSITYQWTLTSAPVGSGAALSGDTTSGPTFGADMEGAYEVELVVSDGDLSDSDTVIVTARPNQAPTAEAGPSQTISDADGSGSEIVVLDGSASDDPDGTIDSYEWTEDGAPLGTGIMISSPFAVGTYDVTLTVMDNENAQESDTVTIIVLANQGPSASFTYFPGDPVVGREVTFDASGSSDPDGTITSYSWDFGDGSGTGSGVNPAYSYSAAGTYTVTLTVAGNAGVMDQATASVIVSEEPSEITVFFDSFESSSDWSLNWSQDGQNDWRRRTARAYDGSCAAQVDGRARNAQLISMNIDLQGRTNATVAFWWFIERGLDYGEYLAFDVSTDGGDSWTQQAGLDGNIDQENTWHYVEVQLTDIGNPRIRFRGTISSPREDAYLDMVEVIAW